MVSNAAVVGAAMVITVNAQDTRCQRQTSFSSRRGAGAVVCSILHDAVLRALANLDGYTSRPRYVVLRRFFCCLVV